MSLRTWLYQCVINQLSNAQKIKSSTNSKTKTKHINPETGELQFVVKEGRKLQVIRFLPLNPTSTKIYAEVADRDHKVVAELSSQCLAALGYDITSPSQALQIHDGRIVSFNSFTLVLRGSDGATFFGIDDPKYKQYVALESFGGETFFAVIVLDELKVESEASLSVDRVVRQVEKVKELKGMLLKVPKLPAQSGAKKEKGANKSGKQSNEEQDVKLQVLKASSGSYREARELVKRHSGWRGMRVITLEDVTIPSDQKSKLHEKDSWYIPGRKMRSPTPTQPESTATEILESSGIVRALREDSEAAKLQRIDDRQRLSHASKDLGQHDMEQVDNNSDSDQEMHSASSASRPHESLKPSPESSHQPIPTQPPSSNELPPIPPKSPTLYPTGTPADTSRSATPLAWSPSSPLDRQQHQHCRSIHSQQANSPSPPSQGEDSKEVRNPFSTSDPMKPPPKKKVRMSLVLDYVSIPLRQPSPEPPLKLYPYGRTPADVFGLLHSQNILRARQSLKKRRYSQSSSVESEESQHSGHWDEKEEQEPLELESLELVEGSDEFDSALEMQVDDVRSTSGVEEDCIVVGGTHGGSQEDEIQNQSQSQGESQRSGSQKDDVVSGSSSPGQNGGWGKALQIKSDSNGLKLSVSTSETESALQDKGGVDPNFHEGVLRLLSSTEDGTMVVSTDEVSRGKDVKSEEDEHEHGVDEENDSMDDSEIGEERRRASQRYLDPFGSSPSPRSDLSVVRTDSEDEDEKIAHAQLQPFNPSTTVPTKPVTNLDAVPPSTAPEQKTKVNVLHTPFQSTGSSINDVSCVKETPQVAPVGTSTPLEKDLVPNTTTQISSLPKIDEQLGVKKESVSPPSTLPGPQPQHKRRPARISTSQQIKPIVIDDSSEDEEPDAYSHAGSLLSSRWNTSRRKGSISPLAQYSSSRRLGSGLSSSTKQLQPLLPPQKLNTATSAPVKRTSVGPETAPFTHMAAARAISPPPLKRKSLSEIDVLQPKPSTGRRVPMPLSTDSNRRISLPRPIPPSPSEEDSDEDPYTPYNQSKVSNVSGKSEDVDFETPPEVPLQRHPQSPGSSANLRKSRSKSGSAFEENTSPQHRPELASPLNPLKKRTFDLLSPTKVMFYPHKLQKTHDTRTAPSRSLSRSISLEPHDEIMAEPIAEFDIEILEPESEAETKALSPKTVAAKRGVRITSTPSSLAHQAPRRRLNLAAHLRSSPTLTQPHHSRNHSRSASYRASSPARSRSPSDEPHAQPPIQPSSPIPSEQGELYAGIRPRNLTIPGTENFTPSLLELLDRKRRSYFGAGELTFSNNAGAVERRETGLRRLGITGDGRILQGGREEGKWWESGDTEMRNFVREYRRLKVVRRELRNGLWED